MRIALAQYDFPVGDITGNVRRIQTLIEQARVAHGADLIVFPELCVSGYSPEDLLFRPQFLAECDSAVRAIAHSTQGIVAVVGWPEAAGSVVYNAASVIRDGRIETTYRKRDLPNHAVFDERRYFETDPDGGVCVFQVGPVRVGLLICQDLWGLEPIAETAAASARLVLVPNASPFERHKHAERDALLAKRARDNGTAIAYVNVVGGQDSTVFDGASLLADARGAVAPAAIAFEEHLLITDFDPELQTFTPIAWPRSADESEDGLMYQALVIGTRDYCKKNGFDKVILGLSGGIDSSLVLAIAADALGGSNVTAVRMPSRYTAELSNDLASAQCEALGVPMLTLPIETPFQAYLDTLAPVFKGAAIDTTEENLQARIRGAMLMALSNKLGGLVLTTGNKSEYAVGYATIYGDMVGGYAPLKDVYKTEVYRLAHWRNTVGPLTIPQGVIQRAPSAELRPDQKDQDSLPPYDVLDALLFRHIDQEQSRAEIVAAGFGEQLVDNILRLVRIAEWKRQQAAPGPKVSRRAFGRERRYPISNGFRY